MVLYLHRFHRAGPGFPNSPFMQSASSLSPFEFSQVSKFQNAVATSFPCCTSTDCLFICLCTYFFSIPRSPFPKDICIMKNKTLSGCVIVFGFFMSSGAFAEVTQWRAEDGGNDHYYDIIVTPAQGWYAMRDQAFALGGYLASIRSVNENSWIYDSFNIGTTAAYWTPDGYGGPNFGGYKESDAGGWSWVSGEAWGYSNFNWSSNDTASGTQFINHTSDWDDTPFVTTPGPVSFIVEWNTNPIPTPAASALLALAGLFSRRRRV